MIEKAKETQNLVEKAGYEIIYLITCSLQGILLLGFLGSKGIAS